MVLNPYEFLGTLSLGEFLNPYEFLVLIPLGIGLPQQILMDKSDLHMTSAMCSSRVECLLASGLHGFKVYSYYIGICLF